VGTLSVRTPSGSTGELYPLPPGRYVISESTVPSGYQAVAPVTVSVLGGSPYPTVVDVLDPIQPASVTIHKVNAQTGGPVAGAVFDISYAPVPGGPFSQNLGDCTTGATGECTPPGNDGNTSLLPGEYQVTEVTPPPGFVLPTNPVQNISLAPQQQGSVTFADEPLVAARFNKVATGNFNPTQVTYAGAHIEVTKGPATSTVITGCTTGPTGQCATPSVLVAGQRYCWSEVAAPEGLLPGAEGCFTASTEQASEPIIVRDPGTFVAVAVKKVDASNPSAALSGATFDLYRVDGGTGPDQPPPPSGATPLPGDTWVARATTGSGGTATFPLQYPGYAYCAVERTPPANYVATPKTHCTGVLTGSPTVPAAVTVMTVTDVEATVTLQAFKFNSLTPYTGIPGATYDLYVQGPLPPSGAPDPPPLPPPASVPDDAWYGRGTTGPGGTLDFTVPSGYAWCLREVSAPLDYVLDPALHCTAVLTTGLPLFATTVALPETRATLHITAQKFNVEQPDTAIPGATYELLLQGAAPPGYVEPNAPTGAPVPTGDSFWGEGTSNSAGQLNFSVPAGFSWCLHELHAPSGYEPDPGFHCTAVLTTQTPTPSLMIALPEQPTPSPLAVLAFTGGPGVGIVIVGLVMIVAGGVLVFTERRRYRGGGSVVGQSRTHAVDGSSGGSGDRGGSGDGGGSEPEVVPFR
jgi:hypothetical protein